MERVAPLKTLSRHAQEPEYVPEFELPSTLGGTFKLHDTWLRKNLVLYFFESAACPPCVERLKALANDYDELNKELDTEVVGISTDSKTMLQALADKEKLPFPLLADENREVVKKYTGVAEAVPAVFIIDKYGTVHMQEVSDSQDTLMEEKEIMDDVKHVVYECPECGVYTTGFSVDPRRQDG